MGWVIVVVFRMDVASCMFLSGLVWNHKCPQNFFTLHHNVVGILHL